MDDETIIHETSEDWERGGATPVADLRAFMTYVHRYQKGGMDSIEIDINNRPVHLLSPRFVVDVKSALEARGYNVTIETHPDEGWIVDWEKSDG